MSSESIDSHVHCKYPTIDVVLACACGNCDVGATFYFDIQLYIVEPILFMYLFHQVSTFFIGVLAGS
jgi:hypothetical protein